MRRKELRSASRKSPSRNRGHNGSSRHSVPNKPNANTSRHEERAPAVASGTSVADSLRVPASRSNSHSSTTRNSRCRVYTSVVNSDRVVPWNCHGAGNSSTSRARSNHRRSISESSNRTKTYVLVSEGEVSTPTRSRYSTKRRHPPTVESSDNTAESANERHAERSSPTRREHRRASHTRESSSRASSSARNESVAHPLINKSSARSRSRGEGAPSSTSNSPSRVRRSSVAKSRRVSTGSTNSDYNVRRRDNSISPNHTAVSRVHRTVRAVAPVVSRPSSTNVRPDPVNTAASTNRSPSSSNDHNTITRVTRIRRQIGRNVSRSNSTARHDTRTAARTETPTSGSRPVVHVVAANPVWNRVGRTGPVRHSLTTSIRTRRNHSVVRGAVVNRVCPNSRPIRRRASRGNRSPGPAYTVSNGAHCPDPTTGRRVPNETWLRTSSGGAPIRVA